MEQKMIFLDLDGTLLNDQKEITEGNRLAIGRAIECGHKVLICTGRPLSSVVQLLEDAGMNRPGCYAITFNGGLIYDIGEQKAVCIHTIPLEQVSYVFEKAYEYGRIHIQTYTEEAFITEHDTAESIYYQKMTKCKRKVVENILEALDGREPCKMLAIAYDFDRDHLEGFRDQLAQWTDGKLDVYFSCKEYLEFMPLGIDKGNAVRWMSEFLNIPMENTIAVGDEENDISMICAAGIGVVMKNAGQKMKQYGNDITTRSNNEDGVAEVIEKYMLE